jgi:hypothetical protein
LFEFISVFPLRIDGRLCEFVLKCPITLIGIALRGSFHIEKRIPRSQRLLVKRLDGAFIGFSVV